MKSTLWFQGQVRVLSSIWSKKKENNSSHPSHYTAVTPNGKQIKMHTDFLKQQHLLQPHNHPKQLMHSNFKNHPLYKLIIWQHDGWRKTLLIPPSPLPTITFPCLFCSSISQHCLCYLFPYSKMVQCAFEVSAIFGIILNNSPDN